MNPWADEDASDDQEHLELAAEKHKIYNSSEMEGGESGSSEMQSMFRDGGPREGQSMPPKLGSGDQDATISRSRLHSSRQKKKTRPVFSHHSLQRVIEKQNATEKRLRESSKSSSHHDNPSLSAGDDNGDDVDGDGPKEEQLLINED